MKKSVRLLTALLVLLMILSGCRQGTQDTEPVPEEEPGRKILQHTKECLEAGKLTVAYYGGSVTEGYGSSNNKNSWASRTTAFLKKTYPLANVFDYNYAVGSMDSCSGLYRFGSTVMTKKPDLVFLEFAINDYYNGISPKQSQAALEGMILLTLEKNPDADIVMVLVTDKNFGEADYGCKSTHRALAEKYGLPIIDVGAGLCRKIKAEGVDFSTYYSDGVHPNDNGYKEYFEMIKAELLAYFNGEKTGVYKTPEATVTSADYTRAAMLTAAEADSMNEGSGFSLKDYSSVWPAYHYGSKVLSAEEAGATLTFTFTGPTLGVQYFVYTDGGQVRVTVDGQDRGTFDTYHSGTSHNFRYLASNLAAGTHTVTLTVEEEKNSKSTGHRVDIMCFGYLPED